MRILYVSESFVDFPLFKSQVHTLCNLHAKKDDVTLLALCTKDEMSKDIENRNYSLIKKQKHFSMLIPFVNKLFASLYTEKEALINCDVIHCRGYIGSAYAINICRKFNLKKPIIADLRGELVEELRCSDIRFSNFLAKQALNLEKYIFKHTPFFFFVSKNMQNHYATKYDFNKDNTDIFPTIVNENYFFKSQQLRNKIRKDLHIENRFVYAYVGGAAYWQNVDQILVTFDQKVKENPNLYLLFITYETETIFHIIETHNLDPNNITVISLPYEEVGKYLNAADAGIIIREDNIINFVASPTKINEYLATGIKIVDRLSEIGNLDYSKADTFYTPVNEIISNQKKAYQIYLSKIR